MARLVIYSSGVVNQTLELTGQHVRIGRAKENDVVLADTAQVVSRFHAELRYEDGQYILLDLNSANGTWVWDHRIQRIVLETGIVAEVGDYRLVLESDTEATTAPPRSRAEFEAWRASARKTPNGTLVLGSPIASSPLQPPPSPVAPLPAASAPPTLIPGTPPRGPSPAHAPRAEPPVARPAPVAQVEPPIPPPPLRAAPPPAASAAPATNLRGAPGGSRSDAVPRGGADRLTWRGRLARQPKALVFALFALLAIVVVGGVIGASLLLFARTDFAAEHLAAARVKMAQGNFESAIREDIDPVLQKLPGHAEAAALKNQASEGLRALQSAAVGRAAEAPVTPPPADPAVPARTPPTEVPARETRRSESGGAPPRPSGAAERAAAGSRPAGPPGRAGEAPTDSPERVQRLHGLYAEARTALQSRNYAAAIRTFERLEMEQPGFLDVRSRLAEARESQTAAARAALANAEAAEKSGDLVEARKEYERALETDPACGAGESLRRVRAQMKVLGDAALKRARTFDALGRLEDAVAQYERALQLLPPDDPDRKAAKERLDVVRAGIIK